MTDLELIRESVAKHAARILDANDHIWEYAELAFHEHKSAALLEKLLKMVRDIGQERTFVYMKFLLGCEKDY